ncbi:MAG TPA: hypothetical protein VFK97_02360, partial [Candidatus Saccharimonadales bacterium]|nr:hypothetical protein [Candidatus Saccharimonadales bacterium]
DYAASSYLKAELEEYLEALSAFRMEKARVAARLALAKEMLMEDEERIANITVMDTAIVLGALSRYREQKPERNLESTIDTIAVVEKSLIPSRIYPGNHLRTRAIDRLIPRARARSWVVQKLVIPPTPEAHRALQTGVNGVELQAA